MSERPEVWSPWQPEAGMWVRVQRGPECRAMHSFHGDFQDGAYGRVEIVDREWDDPAAWQLAIDEDGDDELGPYDPLATARAELGHYYLVQDALDTGRVTYLDGHYCAAELFQVSEMEALAGIAQARLAKSYLTPGERLLRAIMGAAR